jgi:pyruvate dehydrogenase E2 component (dihydrolipoamide acetyltransferase)
VTKLSAKTPYENVVQTISLKKYPRATIAKRLHQSYSSKVHLTLSVKLDMSKVKEAKERLKKEIEEEYGAALSYTGILIKLASKALSQHMNLNSIIEEDEAKVIKDINISVAVQSEKLGLIVPVMRDVDKKSLAVVSKELDEMAEKARKGTLTFDEVVGGTFTISNLGRLDSVDSFTPIINPPQSAILGVGRIIDETVVVDGKVEVTPMCTFSLTVDHRLIDGYPASQFLATLKKIIGNPLPHLTEG